MRSEDERELIYSGITNKDSTPNPPNWFIQWVRKLLGISLFIICCLISCTIESDNGSQKSKTYFEVADNPYMKVEVVVIDECEYMYVRYDMFTHKGNCKYCAERRKNEMKELLYEINK